jgi:hypothetical protein
MSASVKSPVAAPNLYAALALVAGSPIISGPPRRPAGLFADWEKDRKSGDIDSLILAWIASHVPGPLHRSRLH